MNGTVIPQTPIAVDFWNVRQCPSTRIFFLTHFHTDHIGGLTSSFMYPIYCSEITGNLLKERLGVKPELIHTMQVDQPEIVYLDDDKIEQMTVTPLDANHCPGSVMFLFEGYFGTILYTGDFRFHPQMFGRDSKLLRVIGQINVLYLDNTWCTPTSPCRLLSKDEGIQMTLDIITRHPDHDVLIAMYNIGKEYLLCAIAKLFREMISVHSQMYLNIAVLELPYKHKLKHNDKTCRIRAVPFQSIRDKVNLNGQRPTIGIRPTGLKLTEDAPSSDNRIKIYDVPLSDHSSYQELEKFVSKLKPGKIIPIVKKRSRRLFHSSVEDRTDMSCFQKYLLHDLPPSQTVTMPLSVQKFMGKSYMSLQKIKRVKKRKQKPRKVPRRGIIFIDPPNEKEDVKSQNSSISTSKHLGSDNKDIKAKSALFEKKPSSISEQLHTESN